MKNFDIITTNPYPIISALLGLIALFFLIRQYFHPKTSIHSKMAWILRILRTASWGILVFVLFQPLFQYFFINKEAPVDYILLDLSESMKHNESIDEKKINEKIKALLDDMGALEHDVEILGFGNETVSLEPGDIDASLEYSEKNTLLVPGLDQVLNHYPQKNINNLVIVSDGQWRDVSLFERMRNNIPFPVFYLPLGDEDIKPSFQINYLENDPVSYLGESTPVKVHFTTRELSGENVKCELLAEDGTVLAEEDVKIEKDFIKMEVPLNFKPAKIGKNYYKIKLSSEEISKTEEVFPMEILKNKINILMIWGNLNWDFKFIKAKLKESDKISCQYAIAKKDRDKLKEMIHKEEFDVIIWGNINASHFSSQEWDSLFKKFSSLPMIYFSGDKPNSLFDLINTPLFKDLSFKRDMILTEKNKEPVQVFPMTETDNTFFRIKESLIENQEYWEKSPFVSQSLVLKTIPAGWRVLASVRLDGKKEEKLFFPSVLFRGNSKKRIVFLSSSLWKTIFGSLAYQDDNEEMNILFENMVEFIYFYDSRKKLVIQNGKARFTDYEPVSFKASLNKALINKGVEGVIEMSVFNEGEKRGHYQFSKVSEGFYELVIDRLFAPGVYQYEVSYTLKGEKQFVQKDKFVVVEENRETSVIGRNNDFFNNTDKNTIVELGDKDWVEKLNNNYRELPVNKKTRLWDKWPLLFVLIFLLGLEWFLRQKNLML